MCPDAASSSPNSISRTLAFADVVKTYTTFHKKSDKTMKMLIRP